MIPLVSIVGRSGVGKTTLLEKLVSELTRRGVRVAIIKHHTHPTPIDIPGKDSARFTEAGATAVLVASPVELARFERTPRELTLAEIAGQVADADLILAEGFKREPAPKIEVSRVEWDGELLAPREELAAIATDHPFDIGVPEFELDDIKGLADFICRKYLPAGELIEEARS